MSAPITPPGVPKLSLLGGFEIAGIPRKAQPSLGAQRLLASLAFEPDGAHRAVLAERLWPESSSARASANLRSALWQGRVVNGQTLIESDGPKLHLARTVRADLQIAIQEARHTKQPDSHVHYDSLINALKKELLPDWSDDWLLIERERWDQVRLHTLETLARYLLKGEHYLAALEAAFVAVAIEPVRESAHRTVLEIYIAEGNSACALKHYQRYRGLVHRELGVMPSRQMAGLVQPLASV